MLWLALTVLSTTSIGVILKLSEGRVKERLTMLLFNYITASGISFVLWTRTGTGFYLTKNSWTLALIAGVIFALNFFLFSLSVKRRGIALPSILMRLSAIVPIFAAIFYWDEITTFVQVIGTAGALVAAVLMSIGLRGGDLKSGILKSPAAILIIESILLLFCFGLADLSMKIFDETGIQSQKPAFFAVLFFIAAISIAVSMLTGKIVPNLKDSVCGIALGVPNLFSSYCLIAALNELPSIVVFPTVAAATVMLIILIARFIFAEEIGRAGVAGIILTIISLIAINL